VAHFEANLTAAIADRAI